MSNFMNFNVKLCIRNNAIFSIETAHRISATEINSRNWKIKWIVYIFTHDESHTQLISYLQYFFCLLLKSQNVKRLFCILLKYIIFYFFFDNNDKTIFERRKKKVWHVISANFVEFVCVFRFDSFLGAYFVDSSVQIFNWMLKYNVFLSNPSMMQICEKYYNLCYKTIISVYIFIFTLHLVFSM